MSISEILDRSFRKHSIADSGNGQSAVSGTLERLKVASLSRNWVLAVSDLADIVDGSKIDVVRKFAKNLRMLALTS
jgi:hypothetical protein